MVNEQATHLTRCIVVIKFLSRYFFLVQTINIRYTGHILREKQKNIPKHKSKWLEQLLYVWACCIYFYTVKQI